MRLPVEIVLFSIGFSLISAQIVVQPSAVDAVGTEYTIFFEENAARVPEFNFSVQIFITTHLSRPVNVKVKVPLDSEKFPEQSVVVTKGKVTEVNFPQTVMQIGNGVSNKGIHILADGGIVVYGINPQRWSSDGFLAIPNQLLGTEYYAIGMPAEDQHSQLGVVAVDAGNTDVKVTLPNNNQLQILYNGKNFSANDVIKVTLKQFQTFQLQHANKNKGKGDGDISGAHIECSQKCGVFSGNSRTSVDGDSRDHLVEHLPPVATWGKEFAIPPTPQRTDRPDILKLVCQQDNTNIMVDGEAKTCNAGEALQLRTAAAVPHYVIATKPIMAAQVQMSQLAAEGAFQADPSMTIIIPEEQYASTYTIATATWSGSKLDGKEYDNFLTIVIRKDRIDSVLVNGKNINTVYPNTTWKDVPGSSSGSDAPLSTAYLKISSGTHTVSTIKEDTTFMCLVYGAGDRESYAYMGGMRLKVINPDCTQVMQSSKGDKVDNDCDARIDEELCDGTDDDKDGVIDEDCRIENAVIPKSDETKDEDSSVILEWTVYAIDFKSFKKLALYKQQLVTSERVLVANGDGSLALTTVFSETKRYSVSVSDAVKGGDLFIVKVSLTITGLTTKDPGNYTLVYTADNGDNQGTNKLVVKQLGQTYEIHAEDLVTSTAQSSRSSQPAPRNLFFTDGRKYSLTFMSFGGKHTDDLPYRLFFGKDDQTASFQVLGARNNFVTGTVLGMQDIKEVYELRYNEWTATSAFNKKVLSCKKSAGAVVVDAVLNVESLIRPSISCMFMVNSEGVGMITCNITKVTVNLSSVWWQFDGDMTVISGSGAKGAYTATHTVSAADTTMYTAILSGIRADQWSSNINTRVFIISFNQTNGYSLSMDITINLTSFTGTPQGSKTEPVTPWNIQCKWLSEGGKTTVTCANEGGNSAITSVKWMCNTKTENKLVAGNSTSGNYSAGALLELSKAPFKYSASLVIMRPIVGNETYEVAFNRGEKEEKATVTVTGGDVSAGVVQGMFNVEADTVVLTATLTDGQPNANTFSWSLPDGTSLLAGTNRSGYVASGAVTSDGGKKRFTLTLTGGLTANAQKITFNASAGISWMASTTFNLPAKTMLGLPATEEKAGAVNGSIDIQASSIVLTAVVFDGNPGFDTAVWILPDGSSLVALEKTDQYTASAMTVLPGGLKKFTLTLSEVNSPIPRQIIFNCSGAGKWWASFTYDLPARLESLEQITKAVVSGSIEIQASRVVLTASVKDGKPSATSFFWTLPDGIALLPGETRGQYIASTRQANGKDGDMNFTLTLSEGLNTSSQIIAFNATATGNWWAAVTFTVPAKARPVTPGPVSSTQAPNVTCGLRTSNVAIGDKVEIVCTLTTNKANITEVVYENVRQDGKTNVTKGSQVEGFAYAEKVIAEGIMEVTLSFTLTATYVNIQQYRLYVIYTGGFVVAEINLSTVFQTIATKSAAALSNRLVEVESGTVVMTCRVQAADDVSFSNIVWKRVSYAPNKLEQIVFSQGIIKSPFSETGRYSESHKVTADNFLESQLTIMTLARSDAAQFVCVWADTAIGTLELDVIGPAFLVDDMLFQGTSTEFQLNKNYRLTFEFDSIFAHTFELRYNGIDYDKTKHEIDGNDGNSRYDSYAQGNIKTTKVSITNPAWKAQPNVIQTLFQDASKNSRQISTYIFNVVSTTKSAATTLDAVSFLSISTDGVNQFGKNDMIPVERQASLTLTVSVAAPSCGDQPTKIFIGTTDITSQFEIGEENRQDGCLITYKRAGYIASNDADKVLKTVYGPNNTVLSENKIVIISEPKIDFIASAVSVPGTSGTQNAAPSTQPTLIAESGSVIQPTMTEKAESVTDKVTVIPSEVTVTPKPSTAATPTTTVAAQPVTNATMPNDDTQTPASTGTKPSLDEGSCSVSELGCDYSCTNVNEVLKCSCPRGLVLSKNGKTCIDHDECKENPCAANQKCINSYGSFYCMPDCECQCCNSTPPTRQKRSVEDIIENNRDLTAIYSIGNTATVVWLSVLTVFSAGTLILAVRFRSSNRKTGGEI